MQPCTLRLATEHDLPALVALFDAYRQFYEQASDVALAEDFLRQRMQRQESVLWVADAGSEGLLGFCQLYPSFCSVMAAPIFVLYDLFVAPAARTGGLGAGLLHAAESYARAAGAARLDLTTAHNNLRAQSLYQAQGWVRDEVFFTYNKMLA